MKGTVRFTIGFILALSPVAAVQGLNLTVNAADDADDGSCDASHCSLREALNAANANAGMDSIEFDIPGSGPHRIRPGSPLPTITDPVVIDGTTEPDFTDAPIVELDGSVAGPGAAGLHITAGSSTVRGLVIGNFSDGVRLETLGGNTVQGNFIGVDFRALDCQPNTSAGIWIDSPDNTIGGTTPALANVVSCNGLDGIHISGASGNTLIGNLLGTNDAGTLALENGRDGVRLEGAAGNIVGGPDPSEANVIAFNGASGVGIIGPGSTDNQVLGNRLEGNAGSGVVLDGAGSGNTISGNSVLDNLGLGIDLGGDGVTPNDAGDGDSGPNDLQNFPALRAAFAGDRVDGDLNSVAGSDFTIELYASAACDPSGHGEGETLLAVSSVSTDGGGDAQFTLMPTTDVDAGDFVTATATASDGSTSEFSGCLPVVDFDLAIAPDSVVITQGSTANYQVNVTPEGGPFDDPIALDCSGLPGLSECTFSPDTLIPGSSSVQSVLRISTTASAASSAAPAGWPGGPTEWAWLAALGVLLALLGLAAPVVRAGREPPRRRRRYLALLALLLSASLGYAACGDDDEPSGPSDGATPRGSFVITVTATGGPLEHQASARLIIQ